MPKALCQRNSGCVQTHGVSAGARHLAGLLLLHPSFGCVVLQVRQHIHFMHWPSTAGWRRCNSLEMKKPIFSNSVRQLE